MSRAWMPFYVGDYLADTQHLTTLQHGAYVLLIMSYWQRGGLPTDDQAIAQICHLNRSQWDSNCQAIAKLFLPGWKHKRIERELEKANQLSEKRAMSGRKGGLQSRGKTNEERFISQAIAKQTGTQSQSHISNSESEVVKPTTKPAFRASRSLEEIVKAKGWV